MIENSNAVLMRAGAHDDPIVFTSTFIQKMFLASLREDREDMLLALYILREIA